MYIEAPRFKEIPSNTISLFLAGGVSNCPDWQTDIFKYISGFSGIEDLWIINPRRKHFDTTKEQESISQIHWEHGYLKQVTDILFWFPGQTDCPITLLELGKWAVPGNSKRIYVGTHSNYSRKLDVKVQMDIMNPNIQIVHSLDELSIQVVTTIRDLKERS